jgi:quinol monooxygenase YgiN
MAQEFIIAGWMDYGEHRDEVLKHFIVCAQASREEAGCLDYVVTADPDEAGRLVVFERWSSEEELVAHFRTPHIDVFRAAVAAYPRVARDLRRYFVAGSEDFQSSSVRG